MFQNVSIYKKSLNLISEKWLLILVILIYIVYKNFYFETGFFWDSVTILSKPATYLYNNGLFNFYYPPTFDNGDPQLAPFFIALIWIIFGKSLFVTHAAFFILLCFILIAAYRIVLKLFPSKFTAYVFALLVLDPAFMSQSVGLYQDAFLLLFSLFTLIALIERKKILLTVSMLLLCMVSRRAILLTFAFMVFNWLNIWILEKKSFLNALKSIWIQYLPAVLFVFLFIIWRLWFYGWFFTTNETQTGQLVGFGGVVKNTAVLVRWFLDNGRVFLWFGFVVLILQSENKNKFLLENKGIILLFVSLLVIMMAVTLPIANPFGARYFVIHYFVFAILFSKLLIQNFSERKIKISFGILIVLLFSGNFWIYPEKLAQSWDSSLSNLAYFDLRNQTIKYFVDKNVDLELVGVGFPMYHLFEYVDLNSNDKRHFNSLDYKKNKWIVYSNVFNSSDKDIEQLKNMTFICEFRRANVFMRIYKNSLKDCYVN